MATTRPAVPRASAYAHVVNATEVGNTPRKTSQVIAVVGALRSSRARTGAYGKHTSAPTAQHVHVTCSAERRPRTGFCATSPIADATAATRQSSTPDSVAFPVDVATPITTTPANATRPPMTRFLVNRSLRNRPASATTTIGAIMINIEAVPAATRRSASLRTTL